MLFRSIELQFENNLLLNNLSKAKTQLELSNTKLEKAATHDVLTHIPNRRLFNQNFQQAIDNAHQKQLMLALYFIDLDEFKLVNDVYGHDAGDQLLIQAVERLKGFAATINNLARLGGDELLVIVENIEGIDEVEKEGQALCNLLAAPFTIDNNMIKVTASIGISLYPADGHDHETLLKQADKAMYYSKEHGGNNYQIYRSAENIKN